MSSNFCASDLAGKVYVLHLKKRDDRGKHLITQFKSFFKINNNPQQELIDKKGEKVTFRAVEAVDSSKDPEDFKNGAFGQYLGHIQMLKIAKK